MPKMKSHSGIAKRVKVTARGKFLREPAGKRHRLEGKPSRVTRRMSGNVEIDKVETPRIKRLLGL
jgi:large subunit ribosomal protein L35